MVFDLLTKFDIKSFSDIPKIRKSVFCTNDKNRNANAFRSAVLAAVPHILRSTSGRNTFLKHSISNFKSRVGDVHGFKIIVDKHQTFNILLDLFLAFPKDLSLIGLKLNFGVSNKGAATFSIPELKIHPYFKDSIVSYFSMPIGGALSFTIAPCQTFVKGYLFLSLFRHINITF